MQAGERLGVVRAQAGVIPVAALHVAAGIAEQGLDLIDVLLVTAGRRVTGPRDRAVEPLARLEHGVLQLHIAPIPRRIGAQQFIGAGHTGPIVVRKRRLRDGRGAVVADRAVEIESAVALFRRPAVAGGELRKCLGKLRLAGLGPYAVTVPGKSVVKLCKRQAGALETVAKGAAQDFVLFAEPT
jgi:hypothetical protein